MDVQRSLLIGAIVVLGFMLLTEWTAFSNERSAQEASQVNRLVETPGTVTNGGELPTAPVQEETVSDDLPPPPVDETQATAVAAVTADTTQLILVETDVLKLAIDTHGGDIVLWDHPQNFFAIAV